MQLIFGRENAEKIRDRYTVLELETLEKDGVSLEVFCLIPGEKIGIPDLPQLENWTKLHNVKDLDVSFTITPLSV